MRDLAPLTALGGNTAREDTHAGVTLSENADLALASVAARRDHETTCRAHLGSLLKEGVPGPGRTVTHDPESAFWMAPDQWMVSAPYATHEDLSERLKALFGASGSITEQSDAWVCFDMHGDGVEAVMELCCSINIRAMVTGDATRTAIHHLGVYVLRGDLKDHLRILGPRASAASLHHALLTAMKSAL